MASFALAPPSWLGTPPCDRSLVQVISPKLYNLHQAVKQALLVPSESANNIDMNQYMDYRHFIHMRSRGNRNGTNDSLVVLLRDKYQFYRLMDQNNIPVPKVFAEQIGGELLDELLNPLTNKKICDYTDYFAKALNGECGINVALIHNFEDLEQYLEKLSNTDCILQEPVKQHFEMNRLNPNSVNTIRIVTVKMDKPVLLFALLRVGTKDSKECDNTSQGGIAVGIKADGYLTEYGFQKPQYGGRVYKHPDTGVVFKDFSIPYFEEAVQLACKAHGLLYHIRSIGWDIAITDNGPVIIEGNDDWELQSFQALYGGLRERCEEWLS